MSKEDKNLVLLMMPEDRLRAVIREEVEFALSNIELPKVPELPSYITRKETALILGVSLTTLYEWTKSGIVPAKRIGTRVRYLRTDVLNSLKQVRTLK